MNPDRAMTENEAADLLGLSVTTLRAWRHRGMGPRFVRFGRAVRYVSSDLGAFIERSRVDTDAEMPARALTTDAGEG